MSYASLDALWLLLSLGKLIEVALRWRGGAILLAKLLSHAGYSSSSLVLF